MKQTKSRLKAMPFELFLKRHLKEQGLTARSKRVKSRRGEAWLMWMELEFLKVQRAYGKRAFNEFGKEIRFISEGQFLCKHIGGRSAEEKQLRARLNPKNLNLAERTLWPYILNKGSYKKFKALATWPNRKMLKTLGVNNESFILHFINLPTDSHWSTAFAMFALFHRLPNPISIQGESIAWADWDGVRKAADKAFNYHHIEILEPHLFVEGNEDAGQRRKEQLKVSLIDDEESSNPFLRHHAQILKHVEDLCSDWECDIIEGYENKRDTIQNTGLIWLDENAGHIKRKFISLQKAVAASLTNRTAEELTLSLDKFGQGSFEHSLAKEVRTIKDFKLLYSCLKKKTVDKAGQAITFLSKN